MFACLASVVMSWW